MNKPDRRQLQAELAAEREALLAVVSGVDEQALTWPTRNAGWAVGDVLGHVLASDTDLIQFLEVVGRGKAVPVQGLGLEEHQREMADWKDATPQTIVRQLRERADRWRALLDGLPDAAFAIPAQVAWAPEARSFGDIVGDWIGHDTQHAEDVRLALEDGRAETAE